MEDPKKGIQKKKTCLNCLTTASNFRCIQLQFTVRAQFPTTSGPVFKQLVACRFGSIFQIPERFWAMGEDHEAKHQLFFWIKSWAKKIPRKDPRGLPKTGFLPWAQSEPQSLWALRLGFWLKNPKDHTEATDWGNGRCCLAFCICSNLWISWKSMPTKDDKNPGFTPDWMINLLNNDQNLWEVWGFTPWSNGRWGRITIPSFHSEAWLVSVTTSSIFQEMPLIEWPRKPAFFQFPP